MMMHATTSSSSSTISLLSSSFLPSSRDNNINRCSLHCTVYYTLGKIINIYLRRGRSSIIEKLMAKKKRKLN